MSLQLIFVVETNDKTKSDDVYISELIKSRYDLSSNEYVYNFVHMNGKTKYDSSPVKTGIKKLCSLNKFGDNVIIFCFDTDRIDIKAEDTNFMNKVEQYCIDNSYKYVWFCYDIECVFLGNSIQDAQKKSESLKYIKNNKKNYNQALLKSNTKSEHHSNILCVLDDLLPIK